MSITAFPISTKTIAQLSSLSSGTVDRANDVVEITDVSASSSLKVTPNALMGITGSAVGTTDTQNVTNKTFDNTNTFTTKDTLFTLQDDGDTTKQVKFQLSGLTTATTRTFTFPDATDTIVVLAATQTLTNKTLTSPTITGGTIDNSTVTVDAIAGHTTSNTGTVYGIAISAGVLTTNNVVPNNSLSNTGAFSSNWAWTAYTPTYTNLTVGNGVHQSLYSQIGKTIIARIALTFGTTSSMGTTPTFTLPVASVSTYTTGEYIGGLRAVVAGAGYMGYMQWSSTTTGSLLANNAAGTNLTDSNFTASIPAVWTTGNTFAGTIMYEAA